MSKNLKPRTVRRTSVPANDFSLNAAPSERESLEFRLECDNRFAPELIELYALRCADIWGDDSRVVLDARAKARAIRAWQHKNLARTPD